jgi:hypothetical protein
MMLPHEVFPPESWLRPTSNETRPTSRSAPADQHQRVARVVRLDGGAMLYVVRFGRHTSP